MRRAEQAVKAVKEDILGKRVLETACGCADFAVKRDRVFTYLRIHA